MIIDDVTGRPVTAMKVFGTSIRALMNHLFLKFTERGIEVEPKDIRWILTVPAIWSDAAKQFMRKSANLVITVYTKIILRQLMYIVFVFFDWTRPHLRI